MCNVNPPFGLFGLNKAILMAKKYAISVEQPINNESQSAERKTDSTDQSTNTNRRLKTGGRTSISIEQQINLAVQRSRISELNDDVTLESPLAALYLGISLKKLEELRRPIKKSDVGVIPRLPFLKIFDAGAIGQNQPTLYKLGDLRFYQQSIKVTDSHQAAVGAGLASWLNTKHPFFVKKSNSDELFILGNAWDMSLLERDMLFLDLFTGRISIKYLKLTVAALCEWQNYECQKRFIVDCEDLWNLKSKATTEEPISNNKSKIF